MNSTCTDIVQQYGKAASPSEIESLTESGESCCPICQDNPMNCPVILTCSHIFCEECISECMLLYVVHELLGFEREKTCPVCRAVYPVGRRTYSDGSTSLLPEIS